MAATGVTGRLGLLLPLLLLLVVTSLPGARSQECSDRCRCSDSLADCSNSELTWGPRPLPPDTRILNLENNALKMIFRRTLLHLPNLEELRLSGNKIRAIRNNALSGFPRLLKLDASRNQMQNVQRLALSGLRELKTLSLSNNNLRHVQRIFSQTPALQQLTLAFNRIRQIGSKDFEATTRVHYLDLRNNQLSRIDPRAFSKLGMLRYLLLDHNPLASLPTLVFPANSLLQILDLNHCRLQDVPRGLPASTTDLRLGHNRLRSLGARDLQGLPRLRLAALNDNNISSIHPDAFSDQTRIAEIWLRSNQLREIPRGLPLTVRNLFMDSNLVSQLPHQAFGQDSRLEQLTMQGNRLESIHPTALQGLQHLKTASFQGNVIQQLLPGTFSSLPNLTSLTLSNNPLQDVRPGAFQNLPALKELSLSYAESYGENGDQAQMDPAMLEAMPALTKLDMMNSPRLTTALLQSLARDPPAPHSSLQVLDLSYNELTSLPEEVRAAFPSLTRLNLEGNPWQCDRNLLWLKRWMLESPSLTFYTIDPPTCEEPFNLKGTEITAVPDDQFAEVTVLAPQEESEQPNAGGLTEVQGSQGSEASAGEPDLPPLNDQGPLYQPIGGRAYGRPEEIPSYSAAKDEGKMVHTPKEKAAEKTVLVDDGAKPLVPHYVAGVHADKAHSGQEENDLTIHSARTHGRDSAPAKNIPDAHRPTTTTNDDTNKMKKPAEDSVPRQALAIMHPGSGNAEKKDTEDNPTDKGTEVSTGGDSQPGKDVQVQRNSASQSTPQRATATSQRPNAVKKQRGRPAKRRRRPRKGRGQKRARKGRRNGKGRKNRKGGRRWRRRRQDKKKGQAQKTASSAGSPAVRG